jgi:hypothetical protein
MTRLYYVPCVNYLSCESMPASVPRRGNESEFDESRHSRKIALSFLEGKSR